MKSRRLIWLSAGITVALGIALTQGALSQIQFPYIIAVSSAPTVCQVNQFQVISPGNAGAGTVYGNSGTGTSCAIIAGTGSGGDSITSPGGTITVGGTSIATTLDINLAHANTFSATQTAPGFYLPAVTSGPYVSYFNDFFSLADVGNVTLGVPTGQSCALSTTHADANHNDAVAATSGTNVGVSSGVACYVLDQVSGLNTSTTYTWGSLVYPSVLPGTTAGAYQAGLTNSASVSPWTSGLGFLLSSANSVKNDWYCQYSTTYTDSGVAATLAWTRLAITNDGVNAHWWINGVEATACATAVTNLPSSLQNIAFSSVAGTTASQVLYIDYVLLQQNVTR